ncbi:DUF6042 family protein [Paenibacillus soyae]|uniref:DUF6042 family protein n=1 Tax=Paenibacillus soyae TaxID=2969249 RepID=A0A9X2ML59_9BACL|nr:DUF6042 family protein [Paenibacillus soyae]MCR2802676.1 DUF6042 family protein [Paenibacillus soyae]
MCTFQNDVINFMTNGKVTVRGLTKLGLIPKGHCVIPNQFYERGWGKWLPIPNLSLLPFFSVSITSGLCWEETIAFLEEKTKPDTFKKKCEDGETASIHQEIENLYINERETEIKRRLEANGFQYPESINDVVSLYIALGLAFDIVDLQGLVFLDMIIRPLQNIDDVLLNP